MPYVSTFLSLPDAYRGLSLGTTITEMMNQVEAMRRTISAQKTAAASSSEKTSSTKKSGKKSAAVPGDDDVLAFEQKKDLSEAIQTLDGQRLEEHGWGCRIREDSSP